MLKIIVIIVFAVVLLSVFGSLFDFGQFFSVLNVLEEIFPFFYDLIQLVGMVLSYLMNSTFFFIIVLVLGVPLVLRLIFDFIFMRGD